MVCREHMLSKSRGSYVSVLQSPAVFTKTMVQGPTCLANVGAGAFSTWDAVHHTFPAIGWYWVLGVHKLLPQGPVVFSANHQVDLSKAMVIDTHNHTQTRCMLESWHIQHHQSTLNREKGTLPGLYAALLS